MHKRIDQAIDMGLGAGLMYLLDPDMGGQRREELREQTREGLARAGDTLADVSRRAGDVAADVAVEAKRRAAEMAADTAHLATDTATEARRLAADVTAEAAQRAAEASVEARRRVAEVAAMAGHRAADASVEAKRRGAAATTKAAQRAAKRAAKTRERAARAAAGAGHLASRGTGDLLPAAKLAVFEKLAMDEALMEKAHDILTKNELLHRRRRRFEPMGFLALLLAAGIGVALMYLFDPQLGKRRRALLRDQFVHAGNKASDTWSSTQAEVSHRAKGVVAEARMRVSREPVSDEVLVERVRAQLGRATAHPRSIVITAHDGFVTLSGPILADEVAAVLARVRSVPGVQNVDNQLEVHEQAGRVPGLQGSNNGG